jgi:hypothetical protein
LPQPPPPTSFFHFAGSGPAPSAPSNSSDQTSVQPGIDPSGGASAGASTFASVVVASCASCEASAGASVCVSVVTAESPAPVSIDASFASSSDDPPHAAIEARNVVRSTCDTRVRGMRTRMTDRPSWGERGFLRL